MEFLRRTIKKSCLERLILFGEGSLRKAIHEFIGHYHHERNHQGLGNRLIVEQDHSPLLLALALVAWTA